MSIEKFKVHSVLFLVNCIMFLIGVSKRFTVFWSFGSVGYTDNIFESRVSLSPGLGGVRVVVSAIIPREQTLLVSNFRWMLYFQRIPSSD